MLAPIRTRLGTLPGDANVTSTCGAMQRLGTYRFPDRAHVPKLELSRARSSLGGTISIAT